MLWHSVTMFLMVGCWHLERMWSALPWQEQMGQLSCELGLTASQVFRLIGLLLVFASQKIVHNVRNEMAEVVVQLRKKTKDSLTRQSRSRWGN